jgi:aspartate/methionine/tyrosine aminotransferase
MIVEVAKKIRYVDEYFFSSRLQTIEQMKSEGLPVINLGIGNPDRIPERLVIKTMIKSIQMAENHGYQSYKGNVELLSAFAKWYSKHLNIQLDAKKNFLALNGSKEGINFILASFINAGDEVLIPDPGYPAYRTAALLNYAKIKTYSLLPENNYEPDFEELEKKISKRTKIIFTNYPNMPTGKSASIELFQKLVDFATDNKILLVNDNPYLFLFNEKISVFNASGADKIAIELNSLSKSHNMAGWRIGVAIAHENYIKALLKIRSNYNSGLFKPIQDAAIQALNASDEWYLKQQKYYNQRRIIAEKALKNLDFFVPDNQKGMFVWAKIPQYFENADFLSDFLLKKAFVFVTPGSIFGNNGNKFIRISLCADIDTLFEAFRRIKINFDKIKI